jgi:murein DD-endopeptidase MepM/ murein hydrolase activator NlpD
MQKASEIQLTINATLARGFYVRQIEKCAESARILTNLAHSASVAQVLLQIADGDQPYPADSTSPTAKMTTDAITRLRAAEIAVWGWATLHGGNADPIAQARCFAAQLAAYSLDMAVFYIRPDDAWTVRMARQYLEAFFEATPFPVTLAICSAISEDSDFPIEEFARRCITIMPQMRLSTDEIGLNDKLTALAKLCDQKFPGKAIVPTAIACGTEHTPTGVYYWTARPDQIDDFLNRCTVLGFDGVNFWSWQELHNDGALWAHLGAWTYQPIVTVTVPKDAKPAVNPATSATTPIGVSSPQKSYAASPINDYIKNIQSNYPLPPEYKQFWSQAKKLGLPDPFDTLPVIVDAAPKANMKVNGFGPNSFAFNNWHDYYSGTCGMHNGFDYIIPLGTPLCAVADGVIVGGQAEWPFLKAAAEKTVVLWCFLPPNMKDSQGRRMMSNVLVAYGHMSDNTKVKRHQVVKSGDLIGLSGRPAGETSNDHLHLEVHMLTGDPRLNAGTLLVDYKGRQAFRNMCPFNPLLFFSERLNKYHIYQGQSLGYGGGPNYPSQTTLTRNGYQGWPNLDYFTVGQFIYGGASIWNIKTGDWPSSFFSLPTLMKRIADYTPFDPYPTDFLNK